MDIQLQPPPVIPIVSIAPQSNSDLIVGLILGGVVVLLICFALIKKYSGHAPLPLLAKMGVTYIDIDKVQPIVPTSRSIGGGS
jgi:hypothetical protein